MSFASDITTTDPLFTLFLSSFNLGFATPAWAVSQGVSMSRDLTTAFVLSASQDPPSLDKAVRARGIMDSKNE